MNFPLPPDPSPSFFVGAVRDTILAGGDGCSRSVVVGACAAALDPDLAGVPDGWIERADAAQDTAELAAKVYAAQ